MSDNFNKKRIIKNTGLLYLRMAFTMWLNLYATRLVLANLGIDDMGVYGVVGSIVGLFAVFGGVITQTIQRFITFEVGKKDGMVSNVFSSSLNISILLAFFVLFLLETVGLWILNHNINIPIESIDSAFWVFQFSIFSCFIGIISIPYNALIIAYEKLNTFAYISVVQVILNCLAAYIISSFNSHRLIIYAVLIAIISILIRIIYQIYCHYTFKNIRYSFSIDKATMKEICKFAGISSIYGLLYTISNQGIVIIINWIFGVTINAVYTIAIQLKNSILSFALNLHKAIAPQITKTYANQELETHKKLIYSGCKIEIFLIYIIMIPFLFKTEYIMKLWLGNIPPYTIPFVQCTIFISLIYAIFEPIRTAVLATNKITRFLLLPELLFMSILPITYCIGKFFTNPKYIIFSIVIMELIMFAIRIHIATRVSVINTKEVFKIILLPSLIVACISSICCYFLNRVTPDTILGLCTLLIINSIMLFLIIYYVGINNQERKSINILIKTYFNND